MHRYILNLAITHLFFILVDAQTIVKGKVIDAQSKQPLEAASITGENSSRTITDQFGNFYMKASLRSYIAISYIGYKTSIVEVNEKEYIEIELQPNAVNLKDITVQANCSAQLNSISKIDLNLKPVRNTQELLRLVPGLFIAQHAGGGKAEQIFLRGFDCDHGTDIQVSIDGLPVNMVSHAHGQGYADLHFVIPETINNIDFGAGPYYTHHGNLNTAGYVSFSTFHNIDKSRVQIEAGRFDTYRALAIIDLLKKNKDRQSAYLASDFYYTEGPTINPQDFKRFNIFGKYNLVLSNTTQVSTSVSSFTSKWNASGQVPSRAVESGLIDRFGSIDPTEGGNTKRENANIQLSHQFSNGASWMNQGYYSHYIFNLYSDFTFFLNDPVSGDEINQAEKRNIYGYSSTLTQNYFFKKASLQSTYGLGTRSDAIFNSKLAHVVKREFLDYIQLGDIRESNSYAFAEQQVTTGKWIVNAGVRFDYLHFNYRDKLKTSLPSQAKSMVSPKINVQYTINDQLQLFVKAGKGFHSNDARVVAANNGRKILPAAYGADLGLIVKPLGDLYINVAAWYLYLQQEFVYVGDDGNIEPSGRTKREGLDFIMRYQISTKLFANVNLNLTQPRALGEPKGRNYIPLAPTATSTGGLFYKQKQGFNGSLTYSYIKDRPANDDNSIVAKGYFLLDGAINYTKSKYEVGLAVENILNVQWNEAQFATVSRLKNEPTSVTELNFTPGTPLFARMKIAVFF